MTIDVVSELQGTVVALLVRPGDSVRFGGALALIESMKMHHEVAAPADGIVESIAVAEGSTLAVGDTLMALGDPVESATGAMLPPPDVTSASTVPLGLNRPDLSEVIERHEGGLDAARPDAVAKRRRRGRRTARENVADLVDDGSFIEYGPLVIAAQRRRRGRHDRPGRHVRHLDLGRIIVLCIVRFLVHRVALLH